MPPAWCAAAPITAPTLRTPAPPILPPPQGVTAAPAAARCPRPSPPARPTYGSVDISLRPCHSIAICAALLLPPPPQRRWRRGGGGGSAPPSWRSYAQVCMPGLQRLVVHGSCSGTAPAGTVDAWWPWRSPGDIPWALSSARRFGSSIAPPSAPQ